MKSGDDNPDTMGFEMDSGCSDYHQFWMSCTYVYPCFLVQALKNGEGCLRAYGVAA